MVSLDLEVAYHPQLILVPKVAITFDTEVVDGNIMFSQLEGRVVSLIARVAVVMNLQKMVLQVLRCLKIPSVRANPADIVSLGVSKVLIFGSLRNEHSAAFFAPFVL